MEEYNIKINYIKGVQNIVADVLSRYPTQNNPDVESKNLNVSELSEIFATTNDLPTDAIPLSFKIFSDFQKRDHSTVTLFWQKMLIKNMSPGRFAMEENSWYAMMEKSTYRPL